MVMGMAKAGLSGFGLVIVPVMALVFGPKESTGVLLPTLIIADIMAVIYYRSHAVWPHILRILPWVAAGITIGLITGNIINASQFRFILVSIVWIMLFLMILNDLRRKIQGDIPQNPFFAAFLGLSGGFATMIGNAAGPVFTLYFLALKLPKKEFIGTSAWLFLIMNTGKLPLQFFVWKNITPNTLMLNLISIPAIAAGIFLGIYVVKLFPEKIYRYFVIITTLVTSLLLFII
jgi:uncharacterized membrane protein YfcA